MKNPEQAFKDAKHELTTAGHKFDSPVWDEELEDKAVGLLAANYGVYATTAEQLGMTAAALLYHVGRSKDFKKRMDEAEALGKRATNDLAERVVNKGITQIEECLDNGHFEPAQLPSVVKLAKDVSRPNPEQLNAAQHNTQINIYNGEGVAATPDWFKSLPPDQKAMLLDKIADVVSEPNTDDGAIDADYEEVKKDTDIFS